MSKINKKKLSYDLLIPLITLTGLILLGLFLSDRFLKVNNFRNLLINNTPAGLVSIGILLVMLTGGIDISVGSLMGIGSISVTMLLSKGVPVFWAIIGALLFGAVFGLINGLLITKGNLEPIITTLITMIAARAVVYFISSGAPVIRNIPEEFKTLGRGSIGVISNPIIYLVLAFVLTNIFLKKTILGRYIYAIGGSERTSRLFGIRTDLIKISVYTICSILATSAGVLVATRLGMGDPNSGMGMEMIAITMVVIGGTSMMGGKGTALGTFFGVMTIGIIGNLLQLNNISSYFQPVLQGSFIIVIALILNKYSNKSSNLAKE